MGALSQKRGSAGDILQSIGQKFGSVRKALGQKIGKHKKDFEKVQQGARKAASQAVDTAYKVGKRTEGAVKRLANDELAQAGVTGTATMLGGPAGAAAAGSAIAGAKVLAQNSHRIAEGVAQAKKKLKTGG